MYTLLSISFNLSHRCTLCSVLVSISLIGVHFAQYEIFCAKVCDFWQGWHNTVKILKIGTPEIITIIVLQLEQLTEDADSITNREDPDQTAP